MGGRYSSLPAPRTTNNSIGDVSYFALVFAEPNRMCLLHAGADVIGIIQKSIKAHRPFNAPSTLNENLIHQEGKKEDGSYEIQFRGHPFSKFASRSSALMIKRLLCQIVADLYVAGWDLSVASDLTTSSYHTTWFFRQSATGGERSRSRTRILSLSLSGSDSLMLINAPERLRKALLDSVRLGYTYGAESEDIFGSDIIEVKLNGEPWETSMIEEGIWARKLLLEIFRQFSRCQYFYYAVADAKGTSDSIFFIHQQAEVDDWGEEGKKIGAKEGNEGKAKNENNKQDINKNMQEEVTKKRSSLLLSIAEVERRRSSCEVKVTERKEVQHEQRQSISVHDLELAENRQKRRCSVQVLVPSATSFLLTGKYPFQMEQYFMVSLNRTDSLRLIDSSSAARELIKGVIISHWPYGLKREIKHEMAYEYRFNKSPWSSSGADAIAARTFLTVLFEKLLSIGWRLLATLDISRRRNDKSVFVLKRDPELKVSSGPTEHHFCLSMTDGDKIRIIRGDDHVVQVVRNVVKDTWVYGISREQQCSGAYELQLVGHPWLSLFGDGNEPLLARIMMMEVLRAFHANNWRVVVSADISGRFHTPANLLYNPVSVDSWIVAKGSGET